MRAAAIAAAFVVLAAACTSAAPVAGPTPSPSGSVSPSPSPEPAPSPTASLSSSPSASASPTTSAGPAPLPGARTDASITRAPCGDAGARRTVSFRVYVDGGLSTTPTRFATVLRSILCDRRSWIGSGKVRFRYDPRGSLLIGVRTPDHTESRCRALIGLSVNRMWSCATHREIVLNSARWFGGSPYWPGPRPEYRRMLVNHESGHALGLRHQQCPADGATAPVMMQQSKGLRSPNGNTCERNPWPRADEYARLT